MQLHHLLAGGGLEAFVGVEAGLGLAIEGHQITQIHRIGHGESLWRHLLQVGDEHPKLSAPVAHMVEPQHRVAAKLQHPRQSIANDRGAQMPHVHLLGDVGAGEVHNHRGEGDTGHHQARHTQARIAKAGLQLGRQPLGPQGEVDEAGSSNLGLQAELSKVRIGRKLLHDRRGNSPGRLAQGFGQGQGPIGLEVAEFRLRRWGQLGIEGLARLREGPLHSCQKLALQGMENGQHGNGGPQWRQALAVIIPLQPAAGLPPFPAALHRPPA